MGIFDFLKSTGGIQASNNIENKTLLDDIINEAQAGRQNYALPPFSTLESYKK
jgi:hypothetical protein